MSGELSAVFIFDCCTNDLICEIQLPSLFFLYLVFLLMKIKFGENSEQQLCLYTQNKVDTSSLCCVHILCIHLAVFTLFASRVCIMLYDYDDNINISNIL